MTRIHSVRKVNEELVALRNISWAAAITQSAKADSTAKTLYTIAVLALSKENREEYTQAIARAIG